MSVFMTQFSYTAEAWADLVKNPQDRTIPVKAALQKVGGRLVDFFYCFGDYDGIVICEAPDAIAATAVVLAAIAAGHMKAAKTTVLFTVEDAMKGMGKAGDLAYPAPKG